MENCPDIWKGIPFVILVTIALCITLPVSSGSALDSSLTVSASLDSRIAFSNDVITVIVQILNETDPVYNATVRFVSDPNGTFLPSQAYTNLTGHLVTKFKVPHVLEPENVTILIYASKDDFTDSQVNTSVLVLPSITMGSLNVALTCQNTTINSGDRTMIVVKVTDGTNAVPNASVSLYCDEGSFNPGGGNTNDSGHITFFYIGPQVEKLTSLTINTTASKSGYIDGQGSIRITIYPQLFKFHAEISEVTFAAYTLVGEKARLNVKIKNPSELDLNVSILVIGENVTVFPSTNLSKIVSPSATSTYQTQLESFQFDVTSYRVGEQSMDIEVWQNEGLVDFYLLTFTVFDAMNPSLRSFWVFGVVSGFALILYTFAMIAINNPETTWPKKIQIATKSYEIRKHLLLVSVTALFGLVAYFLATDIPLYYNMIPYFVPLVGKIEPVIGIGVFFSAVAWVFQMRKKYFVSSLFGDTLFLLVIFSLVWNSLLIPVYPLTLSESILFQILITFILKAVFMAVEWAWGRKKSAPVSSSN